MICNKCGATNIDGSSFCVKCGNPLKNQAQVAQEMPQVNTQPMQNTVNEQVGVQVAPTPVQQSMQLASAINYVSFFIGLLLSPFKTFKSEESKLNDTKTSFILALIVSGVMTVVNAITTIINTVAVKTYTFKSGYNTNWKWENLKEIKWIELIGKNFLIYAAIILAIAAAFYVGSLIIKKSLNYAKSLSITASAVVPYVVAVMVIAPLASKIWINLYFILTAVGSVYALLIFYELMNEELKLEGDTKIYFNLATISALYVVGYYALMKLFASAIASNVTSSILDMLN